MMPTWFILYDGDGAGQGDYVGRTTNKNEAYKHYIKCSENPYSVGIVHVFTDKEFYRASWSTNWDLL